MVISLPVSRSCMALIIADINGMLYVAFLLRLAGFDGICSILALLKGLSCILFHLKLIFILFASKP